MWFENSAAVSRWRYLFVIILLLMGVSALVTRVIFLTIIDRHFLLSQGDARTLRILTVPAYRGMIIDRNGKPLAVSSPVASIWIDPTKFFANFLQLKKLANLLILNVSELKQRIHANLTREFLYLKRRIDPALAARVMQLNIPGVYSEQEFRRYYPEGEVTAHVLGFTNVDDQGQEGLELAFNGYLRGIPGKKRVLKDRYGRIVADIENIRDPRPGYTVVLSVDQRIQYLAYKALQRAIVDNKANSGSIVVLDVRTGEILAMVNQPSFNPNRDVLQVDAAERNRAVTDVFEPGSTMKTFSIAYALSTGKYHSNTLIDTGDGSLRIDARHVIHDTHPEGVIDVKTILQKSSNVGATKIMLSLAPQKLWDELYRLGFGQSTHSGLPGERDGSLMRRKKWRPSEIATLSYGYGISVTPLQLAVAYAVIANHGVKIPVSILKRTTAPPAGVVVLRRDVADQMMNLLRAVVQPGGTGTKAAIPGYSVAGKTGTARIANGKGYGDKKYIGSFVGIAPASNPRLVVAVVIRDPRKYPYFGGDVAAPAFATVMEGALRILEIPPDSMQELPRVENNSVASND